MEITASYLIDNGYLENVQISEFEDGTPFAIFEDWDEVYAVTYAVVESLVPQALPLYEEAGLIREPRWSGQSKGIEDIRIDSEVPQIVSEALEANNIQWYDIVESSLGCEWGFSDEYTTCSDCGQVIRTEPDSYHWQPDYYVGDGFIACNRCFNEESDYQEAYIEEKINQPRNAVNGLMTEEQIEALGFTKLNEDYQSGWYDRSDNPQEIYDNLSDRFEEILFFIDGVGQFHVDFGVFVRGEIDE